MKKKIYVVKIGRETGIFDDWKEKCKPQVIGFPGALYHGFDYRTEFENEDENKEGSLRHAFMLAEKYMSDFDIGGLKLVYKGEKKDYIEEDRWKKEGFLPFVEEISDDAGNPQREGEYDDIGDYSDEYGEYGDTDEYNDIDENDGRDESSNGFVYIEDGLDEELPFAYDAPADDTEPERRERRETSSEESTVYNYDHTREEEVYSKLHIPERPNQNEPWVEILLQVACDSDADFTGGFYTGRYFVPAIYTALLKLVFDPRSILYKFAKIYQQSIYSKIKDEISVEISPKDWLNEACEVWEDSDEYRALKQRFEKYGMEYMDFDEILKRCRLVAEDSHKRILQPNFAYSHMKNYIKQGGHSLSDLYRELTENSVYRKELMKVSGPFVNPDLEKKSHRKQGKETWTESKQLVMDAEAIGVKLREQVIGQDYAIDKLESAFFHAEKSARQEDKRKGPRNVFLFAGPSGVGKTFMAQLFAEELDLPFRRFDMSGYPREDSVEELAGVSTFWKDSKPGVLTDYVNENPHSVLLFDEIEKAHGTVIRLFLQILDDGICFDRHYDTNISFEDTIIIFTTNAGKQLYRDAKDENLTVIPDKVVLDALEKDINPETKNPFFPPEILSRMSSHTVIMFNHLKPDALRRVVEKDVENQLTKTEEGDGYNLTIGKSKLAKTVLYSMGGSADARNASKLAGKLIDQQLYEFQNLMMQKMLPDNVGSLKKIEWDCDFTGATDEVRKLYTGEKNCVILVLGAIQYESFGSLKENGIIVKDTTDSDAFMEMLQVERVLFVVIDYTLGLKNAENNLNITDARTAGRDVFLKTVRENKAIPIYILCGGKSEYEYTDREKNDLLKRGARGFINREYYENELEAVYWDVCCQEVMDTLALRHQVLTYKTRKEFVDERYDVGKIEFYDLKLETAVESEDKSSMLSDDLRPNKSWDDVYLPKHQDYLKKELEFFIDYLIRYKEYHKSGVRPRGVLLYGPPGTGKTSLAKVVASESKVNFLPISGSELYNGGPEKVQEEFRIARKYAPAILFIDEIDAIGMKREYLHVPNPTLNALLTEMDGFNKADSRPVFVMAATNFGSRIDSALERRFDMSIMMDVLDKEGNRELLKKLINKHSDMIEISDKELENIVDRSEGLSPAKLEKVVETALREGIWSEQTIKDDLFDEIFERCTQGEERVDKSPEKIERTAYHEAGHALIELYYGRPPVYMSIVARGGHGGYTRLGTEGKDSTKEYYLGLICSTLGGRAAEIYKYGNESGLTYGPAGDLKNATYIATDMVCRYGMYEEEIGMIVSGGLELNKNGEIEIRCDEKEKELINRILSEQLKEAIRIIETNKDALERLVNAVITSEKKYLTKEEIQEIAGGNIRS